MIDSQEITIETIHESNDVILTNLIQYLNELRAKEPLSTEDLDLVNDAISRALPADCPYQFTLVPMSEEGNRFLQLRVSLEAGGNITVPTVVTPVQALRMLESGAQVGKVFSSQLVQLATKLPQNEIRPLFARTSAENLS